MPVRRSSAILDSFDRTLLPITQRAKGVKKLTLLSGFELYTVNTACDYRRKHAETISTVVAATAVLIGCCYAACCNHRRIVNINAYDQLILNEFAYIDLNISYHRLPRLYSCYTYKQIGPVETYL